MKLSACFRHHKKVAKELDIKFALACPQPILRKMFIGVGLDFQFPIYESIEASLVALKNIEKVKMGAKFGWIDKEGIENERRTW